MKLYILENFLKSIPQELKSTVIQKIGYFHEQLTKYQGIFNKLPSGFWVRKIYGRDDLLKFRINNGDRIIFTTTNLSNINRGSENDGIILIEYSKHDSQARRMKNINPDNAIAAKLLEINTETDNDKDEANPLDTSLAKIDVRKTMENSITYEIVRSDSDLAVLVEEGSKFYNYYLNQEQYSAINLPLPVLLSGSAGSGKTLVGIQKLYHSALSDKLNICYFTYTENLREHAEEVYRFISSNSIELPKSKVGFFSINGFCMNELKLKENRILNFEKFVNWFNKNRISFSKEIKEIGAVNLWTEIRGIIKGFMGIDWFREFNHRESEIIDREDYIELSDKYSMYSEEEKNIIFDFVEKEYTVWKKSGELFDENDMATEIIKKIDKGSVKTFDILVCDEVQDLTELQIFMLHKLTGESGEIFFSGDIHQIINPTYFSFSRIANLFYMNEIAYSESKLEKNYRSVDSVVKLTNRFSDIRREKIGKFGEKEEYKEKYIREGGAAFVLHGDAMLKQKIARYINERAYAVIVVSDAAQKDDLKKLLGNEDNGRIFTVHEIKGLEYTHVVLCNFVSANTQQWLEIIEGKGRKSTRLRYYFNLMYVAVTRARKNILLFEERDSNFFYKNCEGYFNPIKDFNPSLLELNRESTANDWKNEGLKLEKEEKYEHASKSYKKAGDEKGVKRCDAKLLEQAGRYIEAGNKFYEADEYLSAAEMFKLGGLLESKKTDIKNLKIYYLCLEEFEKAGDMCFADNNDDESVKYYEKAFERLMKRIEEGENETLLEREFFRLEIKVTAARREWENAFASAETVHDYDTALLILERLEKNGEESSIENFKIKRFSQLALKYETEMDYYNLGVTKKILEDNSGALEAFNKALETEQDHAKRSRILVEIAELNKDFEAAGNLHFENREFDKCLAAFGKINIPLNPEQFNRRRLIARAEQLAKNGRYENAADLLHDAGIYDEAYRFFKMLEEKSPWKVKKLGNKFRDSKLHYLRNLGEFEAAGDMLAEELNYKEAIVEYRKIDKSKLLGEELIRVESKLHFYTGNFEMAGDCYLNNNYEEEALENYNKSINLIEYNRWNTRGENKRIYAKMLSSMKAKRNMLRGSYLKAAGSFERLGNIELAKKCYNKIDLKRYPRSKRVEIMARIERINGVDSEMDKQKIAVEIQRKAEEELESKKKAVGKKEVEKEKKDVENDLQMKLF